MPPVPRKLVIATLTAHGLSPAVAEAVRRLGITVRERVIREPTECGTFIDAASGAQLGEIVDGTSNRLDVSALLRAMLLEHRYVCVHGHPWDDSFSPHDVALVLRFQAVCIVSAVGKNGHWHVVSLDPDADPAAPENMLAAFNAARALVAPRYEALVQSGQMIRREAQSAATHEVWKAIVPRLGLRYDRI
jgi:hypothetical protein